MESRKPTDEKVGEPSKQIPLGLSVPPGTQRVRTLNGAMRDLLSLKRKLRKGGTSTGPDRVRVLLEIQVKTE